MFLLNAKAQIKPSNLDLPEALFSMNGKYSLIWNYDTLNDCKVAAWSLYLNGTGEELAIIIPKNDTAFFVSYRIERNYYPYFTTLEGCELKCRIVNQMPMEQFFQQYELTNKPLELSRKLKLDVDTAKIKNVRPPFKDSLDETRFYYTFFLDTHMIFSDSLISNVDSSVSFLINGTDPMETIRLYYSPLTNYYWFQSAVYHEEIDFRQEFLYQDTIIFTDLNQNIQSKKKFGNIQIQPMY